MYIYIYVCIYVYIYIHTHVYIQAVRDAERSKQERDAHVLLASAEVLLSLCIILSLSLSLSSFLSLSLSLSHTLTDNFALTCLPHDTRAAGPTPHAVLLSSCVFLSSRALRDSAPTKLMYTCITYTYNTYVNDIYTSIHMLQCSPTGKICRALYLPDQTIVGRGMYLVGRCTRNGGLRLRVLTVPILVIPISPQRGVFQLP